MSHPLDFTAEDVLALRSELASAKEHEAILLDALQAAAEQLEMLRKAVTDLNHAYETARADATQLRETVHYLRAELQAARGQ